MSIIIISYIISLTTFSSLYCLSSIAARKKSDKVIDMLYKGGCESLLLKKQFWGIVVLGIAVVFYFAFTSGAYTLWNLTFNSSWIFTWIIVMLLTLFISIKTTATQLEKFSGQETASFNTENIVSYFTGRIIFIFLYELFFRGVLLFGLAILVGNTISIIINSILYAILHARCPGNEIIATVPFGIILCLLSTISHSIWPAVLLHIMIVASSEFLIILSTKKHSKQLIV